MELSYGVALCLLITLETIRVHQIPPFHLHVQSFYDNYLDNRDGGVLILSHLNLLGGCAIGAFLFPLLESDTSNYLVDHSLQMTPHAGYIILGLGDAMAAIIGIYYGKTKWENQKRTVEGSLGFFFTTLATFCILFPYKEYFMMVCI